MRRQEESELHQRRCRPDRARLDVGTDAGQAREERSLTAPIYTSRAHPSAPGAVSQVANGCAAQHSGQVLMFEGKTCSLRRAFTKLVVYWQDTGK
jgi:hypothetical protein